MRDIAWVAFMTAVLIYLILTGGEQVFRLFDHLVRAVTG